MKHINLRLRKMQGSRDGAVVEHLSPMQASHQCGPGSIPGLGVNCGLSLLLDSEKPHRVFALFLRNPL